MPSAVQKMKLEKRVRRRLNHKRLVGAGGTGQMAIKPFLTQYRHVHERAQLLPRDLAVKTERRVGKPLTYKTLRF